jgi:predicted RNase H-like HicB family nuclease
VLLSSVEHAGHEYALSPPIAVQPDLDEETQQHFVAEIAELGICAQGRTRDALLDDIASQIAFLWEEYAVANESELTEDAIELRKVLLGRLKRK